MANNRPVIFVHGIMGFGPTELGPLEYWGSAFRVPAPLPRFEASVGPISSAHDRACELGAQIKGARVDYGAEHAAGAGHARFGRDYTGKGFVPDWGAGSPVHLVGHSLGSPTIRCLQHLLATDAWGWGSDASWVASISTISGASNGSTLTYYFDVDESSGRLKPENGITPIALILEALTTATGRFLEILYDFDLQHWGFTRRPDETLIEYLVRVAESPFFWGEDNAAYTLSLQGAYADNGAWPTYPDSFYFSYITEQTTRALLTGYYYPDFLMNPAMLAFSTYIGRKRFVFPPIATEGFSSADWWENDGMVSTYSQQCPRTNGSHPVGGPFDAATLPSQFARGRWYYSWERGMDHLDICIAPQLTQFGRQRRFYEGLLVRLAALDL